MYNKRFDFFFFSLVIGEFFPEHVGIPLGEGHRSTYFMLEVHYDNPSLKRCMLIFFFYHCVFPFNLFLLILIYSNNHSLFVTVRDNSGLRIHYTPNLRQHDAGILSTGIAVSPLHMIPPAQPAYRTFGYCPSQCTNKVSSFS